MKHNTMLRRGYVTACLTLSLICAAGAEDVKPSILTNLTVNFYGYIKLDTAYNSSMTNQPNYVKWAESEAVKMRDDEFIMTANETRFGFDFKGPDVDSMKTSGKIEGEFFSGLGTENKAAFALRHAYVQMSWPESKTSLLLGQTWDVISPLNPATLVYHVYWWAGNIGYRHPQIRLTQGMGKAELQVAVSRTVGQADAFIPTASDTGVDSGLPTAQGRLAISGTLLTDKKTTLGISGHYGLEEYDLAANGSNLRYESKSGNVDLTMPITSKLMLKGELFAGTNMDDYLGGIAQGINTTKTTAIPTSGGWATLTLGPTGKCTYTVGYCGEAVDTDYLSNGNRARNTAMFANAVYDVSSALQLGVEIASWETTYVNTDGGKATRGQFSAKYKF